ncbi:MAG: RHS repeat domain-containing protein [Phycisphaerae bacterium]
MTNSRFRTGIRTNTNYVQEVKTTNSAGTVLADDTYTYRADGLKTGAVKYTLNANGSSDTVTLTWNYDALDRLTSETSSDTAGVAALNYTDEYQYDLDSNRTTETIENGSGTVTDTITSTYNADNQLTQSVDANSGTTVYTYDPNGSQIQTVHTPAGSTTPDSTATSEYTLQGKLAGIQNKNGSGTITSSAAYFYDDQGNRIEVTTVTGSNSLVTTYYLVDGNNPTGYAQVVEQGATPGTPTITYIWGGSLISQDNAVGTANAGTYYLITDGQGSTQVLVNATGSVVQNYDYDGFGNAVGFTISSAITDYLYNQQYYDIISGQYYFRARNYDPATGTFTQEDTIALQPGDTANANLYLYAGADPINMFDPSGESAAGLGQLVHAEIEAMYDGTHKGNVMLLNEMMPGSFGWLFPDIMDQTLGQIAEIKPFSTYGVSTGPVQLGVYLRAANGLAFSWRGYTGPIPPVINFAGHPWEPSTWRIGVVPLLFPEEPNTTVYTLGNFAGIIFYKAFTNDRVPVLIEQDAKNLANGLEDVMRNFAGVLDTGLQVGGGLVTALNYELDAVFNNQMALYAAEAGVLTVGTMIGIGLFQDLSMTTLTAQLAF